jgi:YVTN family beta-propeller protein
LYVYIRPLPDTAVHLRLVLSAAAAVGAGGELVPLDLRVRELDGRRAGRQRLLAVGKVPPGSYRGINIGIQGAWLRGEEGESALLVPREPVFVAVPLTVKKEGTAFAEISYRHEGSVFQGFRLEPEFAAYVTPKPVFSRVGYAATFEGNYLAVFDRSSMEVVSVIGTGRGPCAIAVDERERRAYVALSEDDAVDVVDIPSGQVVARVRLRVGDRPAGLALAPNGILLCANRDSDTVSVIDTRSAVEIDRIRVGDEPLNVMVDRLGRRAFVFNTRSDSISVIDVGRRTVVASVTTEAGPIRGAFNKASDRLFVIHADSPHMAVVDAGSLTSLGRVPMGLGVSTLKVDRNTDLLFLGQWGSTIVNVYDPFSFLPMDFIEVPGTPSDMVIDGEENTLLLAFPREDVVAAVDLVTRKIRAMMDVGGAPGSLGVMAEQR